MRVLDLFSGIGGFSLGLERAGMETVAFCEIEEYPRRVLAKHWPHVPIYDDVRTLTRDRLESDGITGIDLVCGGFPCQDISEAGKRAGIDGERSGLWADMARLVGEIRPRFVLVENVSDLLSGGNGRWFGRVLGDLASFGYGVAWNSIQAADLGASHIRDRVWIAAVLPDTKSQRFIECWRQQFAKSRNPAGDVHTWAPEPMPARVADGVPNRMDRIRALGNAVVPQIPELIGRAILEAA